MKKWIALLLAAVMTFGVVACGNSGNNDDGPGGKEEATSKLDWTKGADASGGEVKLRVTTWRKSDKPYYEEIVKRFEEKYDWIDVELNITSESNSYYSNLQADLMSGTAPDIFDSHPDERLLSYAEAGLIAPQTDFDYMANYIDEAKLVTTMYGENYGYMNAYNYWGFLYNKEIFANLGISVPTSPEELVAAVDKLKGAGYGGIVYGGKTYNTAIAKACLMIALGTEGYGALLEGIDNGTITDISQVEGVANALDAMHYYLEKDALYTSWEGITYDSGMSLYAQEKAAILYMGSYMFGEKDKLANIDTGFFPIPTYADTKLTYTEGAQTTCINAASKNLGAAKLWVEFLATAEISEYFCSNAKMFSTINGVTPVFDEAEMVLNSCDGYVAREIAEPENGEYWQSGFNVFLEGIMEGKDWKAVGKMFSSKLEEYDLKNK